MLEKIVTFYAPFVSTHMGAKFQMEEMLFPLVVALFFGIWGNIPVFWSGRWMLGILCVVVWTFVLYTVQAFVMRSHASPNADGIPYISPSMVSVACMSVFLLSLFLTAFYFLVLGSRTGFLEAIRVK